MQKIFIACWFVAFQHTILAAQTDSETLNSDSSKSTSPLTEINFDECKTELEKTVEGLQNVNIRFNVKVDYRVPNLPRATGEAGEIYLDHGRMFYRFERTFPPLPGRPDYKELEELSFDGDVFYIGKNSNPGPPFIKTLMGDNSQSEYTWQQFAKTCAYLEASGYALPRKVAQWKEGNLTSIVLDYLSIGDVISKSVDDNNNSLIIFKMTIPDPAVFNAQKTNLDRLAEERRLGGSKPAEIDEEIEFFKQLRSSNKRRRVVLWLDSKKKFSLVRRVESTLDGQLIFETEADDFEQFGKDGIWLPNTCMIKTFVKNTNLVRGFTSEPNRTDSIQLDSVSFQPRDDVSFVLDYGPGTYMVDRSSATAKASQSGEIIYMKPAPLEGLRDAAEKKRSSWQWVVIANVILMIVVIGLVTRRHLKR